MAKLTDLPQPAQYGVVVVIAIVVTIGVYMLYMQPLQSGNEKDRASLKTKQAEIAQLTPYETRVQDLERQVQILHQQIELQRRIVPDEKEVPGLIALAQGEAVKAGIEIRRYTPKPTVAKEYYSEVPIEMDVDGPYYSVLNFFERVAGLERIVNVSGVQMSSVKEPGKAKVKKTYKYEPNESVVSSFTATTFYSNPEGAPPPAQPAKGKGKK